MKLWTWQKKGFSLTDVDQKVDSRKHSKYYQEHKDKYEILWERVGTPQFIWCYLDKNEAVSPESNLEYKNHTLWELDVPEKHIFHSLCPVAWSRILSDCRCTIPVSIKYEWRKNDLLNARANEENFQKFWDSKKIQELWDILFSLDGFITPCSTPLIRYPLNELWVVAKDDRVK